MKGAYEFAYLLYLQTTITIETRPHQDPVLMSDASTENSLESQSLEVELKPVHPCYQLPTKIAAALRTFKAG